MLLKTSGYSNTTRALANTLRNAYPARREVNSFDATIANPNRHLALTICIPVHIVYIMALSKLLYNSWVLIAIGIGSIIYLMSFICTGNIEYGVFFIAFGAVASTFSKNMVVILITAIFATEMVRISRRMTTLKSWSFSRREGLENNTEPAVDEPTVDEPTVDEPVVPVAKPKPDTTKLNALQKRLDDIQTEIDAIKGTV